MIFWYTPSLLSKSCNCRFICNKESPGAYEQLQQSNLEMRGVFKFSNHNIPQALTISTQIVCKNTILSTEISVII